MKAPSSDQLLLSIGAVLSAEREKRGIPIEKAAKDTRMRVQRIREMENDDFSHFSNPSYARMFIIAYAKYLGIPMSTLQDYLPERGETNSEGYQYINAPASDLPSLRRDIASRPVGRNHLLTTLVVLLIVAILAGVGTLGFYLYVNLPRLTAVVEPKPEEEPIEEEPIEPVTAEDIGLTDLAPDAKTPEIFNKAVKLVEPAPRDGTTWIATSAETTAETSAPATPGDAQFFEDDQAFILENTPTTPESEATQ